MLSLAGEMNVTKSTKPPRWVRSPPLWKARHRRGSTVANCVRVITAEGSTPSPSSLPWCSENYAVL